MSIPALAVSMSVLAANLAFERPDIFDQRRDISCRPRKSAKPAGTEPHPNKAQRAARKRHRRAKK